MKGRNNPRVNKLINSKKKRIRDAALDNISVAKQKLALVEESLRNTREFSVYLLDLEVLIQHLVSLSTRHVTLDSIKHELQK
jgi:hypothetical protein